MEDYQKSRKLGLIGTVIGLTALGAGVFHFFFGPIQPPPPIEVVVVETATNIKKAFAAKLKGVKYEAPVRETTIGPDKIIEYSVILLGFIAIVIGVVGFVQKESWRPSGMAMALGGGAIAFQFAIVVVSAILAIILFGFILGSLNIG